MSYKRGLAIVFGCTIAGLVAFAATYPRFYPATAAPPSTAASTSTGADSGVSPLAALSSDSPLSWNRLTEAQHVALAPFAKQWDSFSDERKQKWIKIASRYHRMSPEAQERLHKRMEEWVRMTPDERKVARENYQVSKSVPLEKREKAWESYQKLTEEQKKKLAASEHTRRPPAGPKSRTSTGWSRERRPRRGGVGRTRRAARHSECRQHRAGDAHSGVAAAGAVDVQRVLTA